GKAFDASSRDIDADVDGRGSFCVADDHASADRSKGFADVRFDAVLVTRTILEACDARDLEHAAAAVLAIFDEPDDRFAVLAHDRAHAGNVAFDVCEPDGFGRVCECGGCA